VFNEDTDSSDYVKLFKECVLLDVY